MKTSVSDLFQIFAELIRFIQFFIPFCRFIGSGHTAAEQGTCQFSLFKTIHPALQSAEGFFRNIFLIFRRHRKHIYFAESVVRRKERIQPVKQRFHLSAHLIIIDGRHENQRIRFLNPLRNGNGIVILNAFLRFLTGKAANAESNLFSFQAQLLMYLEHYY